MRAAIFAWQSSYCLLLLLTALGSSAFGAHLEALFAMPLIISKPALAMASILKEMLKAELDEVSHSGQA